MVQLRRSVREIAERFDLCGPIDVFEFDAKGNINTQTYLVAEGPPLERKEYLLQLINPRVFIKPRFVMGAMIACIQAQQTGISSGLLKRDQVWETVRLVPTREGNPYLEVSEKDGPIYWRMMVRIQNALTYKNLSEISEPDVRLRVAEEAGRGLALFRILTAGMDISRLVPPLPGYRDTRLYYDQLKSVIAGNRTIPQARSCLPLDPVLRESTEEFFLVQSSPEEHRRRLNDPQVVRCIELALDQKPFALSLQRGLTAGELKKAVVHGDPKLDNFLFDAPTGKVRSLIDLDTVMPHTWLTDWGDMVRSIVNVSGERETDLERVVADLEIFKAAARGFLKTSRDIDPMEFKRMADAPQIMALELGVRFLADYVRGDSYFKLCPQDPIDLNRTRALVQFRVFEDLRRNAVAAEHCLEGLNNWPSGVL